MIRVAPAPEPEGFDAQIRQPGLDAIAERVGEAPLRPRRVGRPYEQRANHRDELRPNDFPELWTGEWLLALWRSYRGICAYSCHYIEQVTGARSTDHFTPKSRRWDLVYEWRNYRLACSLMNERKRDYGDVLDPFEIHDHWFAIDFVGMIVIPGPNLDDGTRDAVFATIERLRLNDAECRALREEYILNYLGDEPIPLPYLERRAPFLARELRRQGRLRPGDT